MWYVVSMTSTHHTTANDPVVVTVQVIVSADPAEAENVASKAADFIAESFTEDQGAVVQTVLVHSGSISFGQDFATGSSVFTGEGV